MTIATPITKTLRIGHSPDPDDAFMWYPLANFTAPDGTKLTPKIDTAGYEFVHVLEDIQSLNERSEQGELEITAFSVHQYPHVAERYAMTACGSSMGDRYGPMIVTPTPEISNPTPASTNKPHADAERSEASGTPKSLCGKKLAIPGERTTAWLTTQLWLAEHGMSAADLDPHVVPFDQILQRVEAGEYDAGLIIHEGQITYHNNGLELLVDLGTWWTDTRGLPLPLGANAIRRDLVESGEAPTICRVLLDSIKYALDHRDEAVNFALNYARDMGADLADRFVGMY
ncbi:MAG: MqnA/MqnD/SBP family protein, partial [Planctomycetota bacterium]